MYRHTLLYGAGFLIAVLLIAGAARVDSTEFGYRVGVDDVLAITVWDNKDLEQIVFVRPDGRISLPLVGEVQAGGRTVTELEEELTELYRRTVKGAIVTVAVREIRSRTIFFVGKVGKPGPLQMTKDLTLLQALAVVGGILPDGAEESTFVLRNETAIPVDLIKLVQQRDLTHNLMLQPGDTVVVPSASTVHVQGEAAKPGEVKYTPGLTILQAILKAGGFTPQAASRRVNVIRRDGDRKENLKIDVQSIMDDPGQVGDVPARPNDVIIVPQRQRFESHLDRTFAVGLIRFERSGVPGVWGHGAALRSQAAPLAPPGHDAVHDLDRGRRAPRRLPHSRRQAAPGAWAEPGSQFTALFERLAIDLLRECSITGAVGLLRISWDEGWGIKARAVKRGLARRAPEVVSGLGVDEKAIAKRHRYLTVVADLDRHRVFYLADDRQQASLDGFWPTLTPAQRDGVTAVAMDMWAPYVQSTRAHLPAADAKIVFDKFHVVKHLH